MPLQSVLYDGKYGNSCSRKCIEIALLSQSLIILHPDSIQNIMFHQNKNDPWFQCIPSQYKHFVRKQKWVMKCYVISVLLYVNECWTFVSQIKRGRLEAKEKLLNRWILRIIWTECETKLKVLRKTKTKITFMLRIRQKSLKCRGHVMKKEVLNNVSLSEQGKGREKR